MGDHYGCYVFLSISPINDIRSWGCRRSTLLVPRPVRIRVQCVRQSVLAGRRVRLNDVFVRYDGDDRVFGWVHCVRVFGSGLARVFGSVRQLYSFVIVLG